jgi:Zn-dependent peptidase ImmA (M78 family)
MSRIEALITPSVLIWARQRVGLSIEEAALKIGRPSDEIHSWEKGLARPTIAQARKTSEVYKRPLAVFYLPEPPQDFETLKDFRCLDISSNREYSPPLALVIRTAAEHQHWLEEFLQDEGEPDLSFVGSANYNDRPADIAQDIRKVLDISLEEQDALGNREESLRYWITKVEKAGVYIFRQRGLELDECRGFILASKIAPFIFLNSEDARVAQVFTLAHELVHIWLDLGGISNLSNKGQYASDDVARVEAFCNKTASEVILPELEFSNSWRKLPNSETIEDRIESISRLFKVSSETIARRLLDTNVITQAYYLKLREIYQKRWIEFKDEERKRFNEATGGPSYYLKKAVSNGYSFTKTVINAYVGGSITGRDASSLLDVKVSNFKKLAMKIGMQYSMTTYEA